MTLPIRAPGGVLYQSTVADGREAVVRGTAGARV